MRRLLLIVCALLPVSYYLVPAMAEEVTFRAEAPQQVIAGKPFQLTYTVNVRARDFRAPEFTDFEYLAGPYTSQSSSTSFVNGQRTSTFALTYTYTLMGNDAGTFTLQPATIKADGKEYASNGVRITVLPPDEQPQQTAATTGKPSAGNTQTTSGNSGNTGSSENIFIRTIVNKTHVREQEAISLSYKLYFAGCDVAQFTGNTKIPEFTGFLKQDLDQSEIQTELEHYNGRNYQTATIYRTLLYPQHSGDIKIDPAQFEAVLRVQTRAQVRSIFDDFFGTYTNVTKALTAPGVTIHVDALPGGKPAGFSGGVGQFTMKADLSATDIKSNEAVTLRLTIQGSGNMKLLKIPDVDWPEGFEVYDPKVTNNFKTTPSGISGSKVIEYLAIPRASGDYVLPAVNFSYFDTEAGAYRTVSSPEYTLHVARGTGEADPATQAEVRNYTAKEDIKQLGTDIRYIRTNDLILTAHNRDAGLRFGSMAAWLLYIIPLLIAAALFILFRKRIRENADVTHVRYKKANKVAQKRLKTAAKMMSANDSAHFYEEIERAAWQYLSDRLSIPTADMSKDNIADILRSKQVGEELISEVTSVLSNAEFARYAPSAAQSMDDLYQATTTIIDSLENQHL